MPLGKGSLRVETIFAGKKYEDESWHKESYHLNQQRTEPNVNPTMKVAAPVKTRRRTKKKYAPEQNADDKALNEALDKDLKSRNIPTKKKKTDAD